MPKEGLSALIGYAIGTAQILGLEWFRARRNHRRQLRLLRAELKRVGEFTTKFGLTKDTPPADDFLPRPAALYSGFVNAVSEIDFWITDEHRDDNSQQVLLGIADGFVAVSDIHGHVIRELDSARASEDSKLKRKHLDRLVEYADEYDRELDRIQYLVKDAIRDLDRRLRSGRLLPQIGRLFRPMPKGTNPPSLTRNDPRLKSGHDAS